MSTLFAPDRVASILERLPALAAALPAPDEEGWPSSAFPKTLRKTDREIYRFLGNTHYDHLVDALQLFERTFAAGCVLPELMRTTSREQFKSATAEAIAAEHFLGRGFRVRPIPRSKERGADLHVTGDGIDAAVEIYSPREWMEIEMWTEALKDLVNSTDLPVSFVARAGTQLRQATPPGEPYTTWQVAEDLKRTRREVLRSIRLDLDHRLGKLESFENTYQHRLSPLETTISVSDITIAEGAGPYRFGTISAPGPSGYSPAGVFRKVVERAVKKARRGQAVSSSATTRALLVNLMHTHIADDLLHPGHHEQAADVLNDLDPREYGLDLVAFYVRALPRGIRHIYSVYESERLTEQQLIRMIGDSKA